MTNIVEITDFEFKAVDSFAKWVASNPSPCESQENVEDCDYYTCNLFNCENCVQKIKKEIYKERFDNMFQKFIQSSYIEAYNYLEKIGYFKAEVERQRAIIKMKETRHIVFEKRLVCEKMLRQNGVRFNKKFEEE